MKRVLCYKLARPDGWDFFSGKTINYRESVGEVVKPPTPDAGLGVCSSGVLHASRRPNDCFLGAKIPCSAYRVSGIPACGDNQKWGFTELKIIREITDLAALFGWKYSEAATPVHPLLLPEVKQVTTAHIDLLKDWASVRAEVGASVGDSVGDSVWASVRASVRASVGDSVWASVRASVRASVGASVAAPVWASVWASVGDSVGDSVRASVGASVAASVGDSVWDSVGAYTGSLFPKIKQWEYIPDFKGYPFQPAVALWKQGIVPSFDGNLWRLHSGNRANVIWEGTVSRGRG